jgi:excisionase family DNA binding protein
MEPVEEDIGYVTVQQAATIIGVHRDAIYQAIDTGKLKPVKVLGRTALRRSDV